MSALHKLPENATDHIASQYNADMQAHYGFIYTTSNQHRETILTNMEAD